MPHYSDTGGSAESNGQRLARIRARHRWTQQRLATEAGYSLAAVKAFEQGRRSLDRAAVILAFARALDCHPTEITGGPYNPVRDDMEGQAAVASIAAVRRALLRHGRPARPADHEVAAVDLPELRQRAERITHSAESLRWAAQDRARQFGDDDLTALTRQVDMEAGALRHWAPADEAFPPQAGPEPKPQPKTQRKAQPKPQPKTPEPPGITTSDPRQSFGYPWETSRERNPRPGPSSS